MVRVEQITDILDNQIDVLRESVLDEKYSSSAITAVNAVRIEVIKLFNADAISSALLPTIQYQSLIDEIHQMD